MQENFTVFFLIAAVMAYQAQPVVRSREFHPIEIGLFEKLLLIN